jgi:hypothetical protein
MTSEEYRQALTTLSDEQRRALNEQILKGNQPTVDQMVYTFERYAEVEPKAVFWLRQHVPGFERKTQADRVTEANIRSAELGERSLAVSQNSLKVSQKSLRAAYWALAVAVVALVGSIIAIWR